MSVRSSHTTVRRPVASVDDAIDQSIARATVERDAIQKQSNRAALVQRASSPLCISVLVGLLSVFVLYLLNPPMVQRQRQSDIEKQSPDTLKVIAWGAAAFGATYGLSLVLGAIWRRPDIACPALRLDVL